MNKKESIDQRTRFVEGPEGGLHTQNKALAETAFKMPVPLKWFFVLASHRD